MDRQEENLQALALRLLLCCRNELYALFPYLDGAFACLSCKSYTGTAATDGRYLFYDPRYLGRLYAREPGRVRRGYLHILLHCLFLHPFLGRGQDPVLWDLACDMAAEQILEKENRPRLAVSFPPVGNACLKILGDTPLPAEKIYEMLRSGAFPYTPQEMAPAFAFDDHSPWRTAPGEGLARWQQVQSYTLGSGSRGSRRAGSQAGGQSLELAVKEPGRFDYRGYLRQFAVPREETELDMDSFDYIYYTLGLERYGDLPLIEPLEYREGHKLEQLVIAIDTSGSCSAQTVRRFLEETYSILSSRENFFRKMEVYFIQCDCLVQSAVEIRSPEQWKRYCRNITVEGRGGTDFTPVFRFVEELRQKGKLQKLKALLYFTDGDGCYPTAPPDYETAFVFLKKTDNMQSVPGWARVLLVEE